MTLTEIFLAGMCLFSFLSFICVLLVFGAVMNNAKVKKEEKLNNEQRSRYSYFGDLTFVTLERLNVL